MINKSHISNEIKNYIKHKLIKYEQINNIQIILAIESGSRAWGFPSIDSDYDVRFIYSRQAKDYLSLNDYNDHIETPIMFDATLDAPFDLNGWDLRKTLKLAVKSNPVLIEWLVSPVIYTKNAASIKLLDFAKKVANLSAFLYHYDRLARNSWLQIKEDPQQVRTKLYCYALRAVIAIHWILLRNETPPMDIASLCQIIADDALYNEIFNVIERKARVKESDLIHRNIILDIFIETTLNNEVTRPSITTAEYELNLKKADRVFYNIIGIKTI